MTVVAHVSPEKGWPILKDFLSKTKKKLVVGMYDFGAKHILAEILAHPKIDMTLVMQSGQSLTAGQKSTDKNNPKKK